MGHYSTREYVEALEAKVDRLTKALVPFGIAAKDLPPIRDAVMRVYQGREPEADAAEIAQVLIERRIDFSDWEMAARTIEEPPVARPEARPDKPSRTYRNAGYMHMLGVMVDRYPETFKVADLLAIYRSKGQGVGNTLALRTALTTWRREKGWIETPTRGTYRATHALAESLGRKLVNTTKRIPAPDRVGSSDRGRSHAA